MPRKIPDRRLVELVEVATRVFVEQGYRRTQMADVATALGVGKGTLYLYVESKEALFDLAVRHADTPDDLAAIPPLPIPTPFPGATLEYVRKRLAENQRLPALERALAKRGVPSATQELAAITGELYDVLARNRRAIKLVDRSAVDQPELAALWFEGARVGAVAGLGLYLEARIRDRHLRPVPDVAAAARLIIETATFWAVHRHWDPRPQAIDDATARETVLRFVVGALAKE